MQLIKVARYGAGENCSTDPFFQILIKVGTGDKNKKREITFPVIPTTFRIVVTRCETMAERSREMNERRGKKGGEKCGRERESSKGIGYFQKRIDLDETPMSLYTHIYIHKQRGINELMYLKLVVTCMTCMIRNVSALPRALRIHLAF